MKSAFYGFIFVMLIMLGISMPVAAEDSAEPSEERVTVEAVAAEQSAGEEAASSPAASSPAASTGGGGGTISRPQAQTGAPAGAPDWINMIIGYISQISALFGQATGIRIGGSTVTGIAALAVAKFTQEKAPSWLKWVLGLAGGTMLAGGGANIAQLAMSYLGG